MDTHYILRAVLYCFHSRNERRGRETAADECRPDQEEEVHSIPTLPPFKLNPLPFSLPAASSPTASLTILSLPPPPPLPLHPPPPPFHSPGARATSWAQTRAAASPARTTSSSLRSATRTAQSPAASTVRFAAVGAPPQARLASARTPPYVGRAAAETSRRRRLAHTLPGFASKTERKSPFMQPRTLAGTNAGEEIGMVRRAVAVMLCSRCTSRLADAAPLRSVSLHHHQNHEQVNYVLSRTKRGPNPSVDYNFRAQSPRNTLASPPPPSPG